jgi:hypothetical protein
MTLTKFKNGTGFTIFQHRKFLVKLYANFGNLQIGILAYAVTNA